MGPATVIAMPPWALDLVEVGAALFLVALNGFFVAAEFALVKVRGSQTEELLQQKRPFSKTAMAPDSFRCSAALQSM